MVSNLIFVLKWCTSSSNFFQKCKFSLALIWHRDVFLVGLEFVIEIQHNTVKPMPNNYMCLLCDHHIKAPKDNMTTIAMALAHVKSSIHKLLYVVSCIF